MSLRASAARMPQTGRRTDQEPCDIPVTPSMIMTPNTAATVVAQRKYRYSRKTYAPRASLACMKRRHRLAKTITGPVSARANAYSPTAAGPPMRARMTSCRHCPIAYTTFPTRFQRTLVRMRHTDEGCSIFGIICVLNCPQWRIDETVCSRSRVRWKWVLAFRYNGGAGEEL